jgi:hypothetical protein
MNWKPLAAIAALAVAACTSDPVEPAALEGVRLTVAKVEVCHSKGDGSFSLISIADPALPTHIAHGDAQPGNAVPGVDGKVFTSACVIVDAPMDFHTFYIRNSNTTITAPWDANVILEENVAGDGFTFATPQGGQKVGYGTNYFDGRPINTIESVDFVKVFGMLKPGVIPYLNIWVTDGAGNFAIIASENIYTGTDFSTRTEWKVFESAGNACIGDCNALDWLFDDGSQAGRVNQYLTNDGANTTLAELGDNIVIVAGPSTYASAFIGTGAPRGGFGFNIIWGDTQDNFAQAAGSKISNLTVTRAGVTYSATN